MSVSTYKRCGCTAPRTDEQGNPVLAPDGTPRTVGLGDKCPRLKQHTHGTWYFYFSIPRPGQDALRIRRGGFATRNEAKEEGGRLYNEAHDGIEVNSKETVEQYLRRWLDAQGALKRSTRSSYQGHIDNHLSPHLGPIKLTELRAHHIDAMFRTIREANDQRQADRLRILQLKSLRDEAHASWKAAPPAKGSARQRAAARPLRTALRNAWKQAEEALKATPAPGRDTNPATQRRIRATLSSALADARRQRLVTTNWAQLVSLPTGKRPKALMWTDTRVAEWERTGVQPSPVMVWTPEQVGRFLDHVADDRLYPLWHLITFRGLRRGEATALPWSAVDLEAGTIAITEQIVAVSYEAHQDTPKADSERTIILDQATLGLLRTWQQAQEQERRTLTEKGTWTETGRVFTVPDDGSTYHPETISRRFRRLVKDSGLPPIRLHDLRHEAATLALAAGTDLKVVQEMLGHSTITLTADTYTSVAPRLAREAAEAAVAVVPRQRSSRPLRVVAGGGHGAA